MPALRKGWELAKDAGITVKICGAEPGDRLTSESRGVVVLILGVAKLMHPALRGLRHALLSQ